MAYIYDLTDTWNAGGTTFYGIKMNVTNTASAAGSKLLSLQVGGSEQFGVDKNGNVGIGTSSPGAKLDVNGSVRFVDSSAAGPDLLFGNVGGGTSINNVANARTYIGAYETVFTNYDNSAEYARIDASGNVGIGVVPSYKLDVSATGNISGQFKTSGSINALYLADAGTTAGTLYVGTVGNDFRVVTGSNEQMRIAANGYVGIGTPSPDSKLHVAGTGGEGFVTVSDNTQATIRLSMSGGAQSDFTMTDLVTILRTNAAQPLLLSTSGTERMRIDSAGNIQLGTASLATTATDGFPYIPTCAGTPTGTPTAITGYAPMVVDSTNNKLYVYVGGAWQAMN